MHVVEQWRAGYANFNVLAFITDSCDYSCWYCYNKHKPKHDDLDLNLLLKYIKFLRQTLNRDIDLDLIGGEPSCHPQIFAFCNECSKFANICIYTNFCKDVDLYLSLQKVGVKFDITFHSIPNDVFNVKFVDKIVNISSSSIRGITVMLDRHHFDENMFSFFALKRIFGQNDVDIDLQLVMVGDECDTYDDEQLSKYFVAIDDDEYKPFGLKYSNGHTEYVSHNQLYGKTHQQYFRWKCNAGRDLVYVHNTGDVYRCDGCYNAEIAPEFNLHDGMKTFNVPILCQVQNCPFEDNVHKWRVF